MLPFRTSRPGNAPRQLCLIFLLLAALPSGAQVLSYEGFDYFNNAPINLHQANAGKFTGTVVTNWDKSLGWAGDWQHNPATVAPATVGTATSATYTNGTFDLITAGHFALSGSHSIGRKLQNSPAGPFSRNGTNTSTNNVTNGTDFLTAPDFTADSYTANTPAIGRDGTTLWLSFLVRKSTDNDDLAYVSLHRNDAALYDGDAGNHLAAGYFGPPSNTGGTRFWSVRINGAVTQGNVPVVAGAWTLLVVRLDFSTATTLTLYVNPTNLGTGTPPGTANATASAAGGQDNTFRNAAWYGGGGGAGFLDELRLSADYRSATTSSDKIRVEGEMCGGRLGRNIFTNGSFDEYSPAPTYNVATSGIWSTPPARRAVDNSGPWVDVTAGSYCYINTLNFGGGGLSDGSYTITDGVRPAWGIWVNSLDVSGTGNLMLANASYRPGVFFRQIPSNSFCQNTTYEFSVMVKNVDQQRLATAYGSSGNDEEGFRTCDPAREPGCEQLSQLDNGIGNTTSRNTTAHEQSTLASINCAASEYNIYDWHTSGTVGTNTTNARAYRVLPDIEFIINDVVAYSPPAPIPNDGLWHKVGFTFTTKPTVTSLELKIRNKAPGGGGNDIALDNFSFRACGPTVWLNMGNFPACNPPEVFSVIGPGFVGPNFPPTHYRWQKRTGTDPWTDIAGAPDAGSYVATYPNVQQGDSIRVNVASSTDNLGNYFCSVLSDGGKVECIIPLPAQLLGFNAVRNGGGARLTWQTASERNCAYFAVERSADGIRFVEAGRVAASGNSTTLQAYHFTDAAAPPGKVYYRLRQVDADDSETYSRVAALDGAGGLPDVALVPNPARTSVRLVFDTPFGHAETVAVRLLTAPGQVVRQQRFAADARTAELTLPLGGLAPGLYVLEVTTRTQRHLRKLVVEGH